MSITIDWFAFVQVFVAAMLATVLVVGFYSLGLRLECRWWHSCPSWAPQNSPTRSP